MKNTLTITGLMVALVAILAFAASLHPDAADASTGPWKTEAQVNRYLETQLPAWADINLRAPGAVPSASCTGQRRYRTDRNGEYRFRAFTCRLYAWDTADEYRGFSLTVQPRRGPWRVTAGR